MGTIDENKKTPSVKDFDTQSAVDRYAVTTTHDIPQVDDTTSPESTDKGVKEEQTPKSTTIDKKEDNPRPRAGSPGYYSGTYKPANENN